MRWLSYTLLPFLFCVVHCRETGTTESTSSIAVNEFSSWKSSPERQNETTSTRDLNLSSAGKERPQNETFTDISPFLLFPILPFLLPEITKKSDDPRKTEDRNGSEARNGDPGPGPFVFFDVTFDTKEIPLENESKFPWNSDPPQIEDKTGQLVFSNLTWKPQEQLKGRRAGGKRHPADLSDAFPLLSRDDSLFDPFADFPFRPKPAKKSTKRNHLKKSKDSKNDMRFFHDAFDEAFDEFREADPVSKFFQIIDGFFNGNRKREVKAEPKGKSHKAKVLDSPAIILDEVVKIGQVHVFDEGVRQGKGKGKGDSPRKVFNGHYRNRYEENARKRLERNTKKKTHSSINHDKRGTSLLETVLRNGSFFHDNITEDRAPKTNLRRHPKPQENVFRSKSLREDLKRNITEVLNRFLSLGETEEFDWTERETLERRKGSRGKRQQKSEDFEEEYVEMEKKEREVADLNFLFLAITLPTVFVLALLLLACFSSFRVKGKICTKLFRPRQVFVVDAASPDRGASNSKTQHV